MEGARPRAEKEQRGWGQIIRLLTHLHIACPSLFLNIQLGLERRREKGKKETEQNLNMVKPIIYTYTSYRTKQPLHYTYREIRNLSREKRTKHTKEVKYKEQNQNTGKKKGNKTPFPSFSWLVVLLASSL